MIQTGKLTWQPKTALILLTVLLAGCGTIVGNPDNPDDDDTPVVDGVPLIDFDLPQQVSGYLLLTSSDSVLYKWANRTDRIIDGINRVLDRLNRDKVIRAGEFTGKGEDGLLSARITEAVIGDYNFQAVVCQDGTPFQVVRWNSTGTRVYSMRDFALAPVNHGNEKEIITEVHYAKGDTSTVELTMSGMPWNVPDDVDDGDYLAEAISATKTGESYTFAGVNNWYDEGDSPVAEGDGYLAGSFNASGAGEFVAFRKHKTQHCTATFNELNADAPGWCLGRPINGDRFNDTDRAAAWQRLAPIGIQPRSRLKDLQLTQGLTCPGS